MVLIMAEYSQRPYRYGMTLLCVGAMFNWLGLAENNAEPVRYIGVTLIAAGAMLICLAMCFWMKASHEPPGDASLSDEQMHHIVTIHQGDVPVEKPPDYDSVTGCLPPCYEDAIRLNPSLLLPNISSAQDVTDFGSTKQESEIPQSTGQSNEPTADLQHIQTCPANLSSPKAENDGKPSSESVTTSSENTPVPEYESSQSSDNFGSKMLRLSKRLLRGKRGPSVTNTQQDGEISSCVTGNQSSTSVAVNNIEQLCINSREDNRSAASTSSTLPVR